MKKLLLILLLLFSLTTITAQTKTYVDDQAQVLNDETIKKVNNKLEKLNSKHQVEVFITTDLSNDDNIEQYTIEQLNQLSKTNSILFLIRPESRDYSIATNKKGSIVFYESKQELVIKDVVTYLKADDYNQAVVVFVDKLLLILDQYKEETTLKKEKEIFSVKRLLISITLGFIVALFSASRYKGELKSVRSKSEAKNYFTEVNFLKNKNKDVFINKDVRKTLKIQNDSSKSKSSSGKY